MKASLKYRWLVNESSFAELIIIDRLLPVYILKASRKLSQTERLPLPL
jgi:hypothetical protein